MIPSGRYVNASEMDTLTAILYDKLEKAFGTEPSVESQIGKLREEVGEFLEDLSLEELADMVVVCCTLARVCGYSVEELLHATLAKMRTNAVRVWGSGDGTVARHVDGEDEG